MIRGRALTALVAALAAAVGIQIASTAPAGAVQAQHATTTSAVPMTGTPNVRDGRVFAIAQVGNTVVLGGSFTQVSPANNSVTYSLPYVVAFDATTGAINTSFLPNLDAQVMTLLPGPTPGTIYVGGDFNNVGGAKFKGLVLLNLSNGSRVATFKAPALNGLVESVERSGNRLYIGGTFTTVGGVAHGGLATLNATTGALDPFMNSSVAINHSWTQAGGGAKAAVGVFKMDVSADGSKLVAIGNFRQVDGLDRQQIVLFDLTGSQAVVRADWRTRGFEPACYSWAYDTYVRDVDISADGTYFVVGATGGGNTTLCDTVTRWDFSASGDDVKPTWASYTGGDTILSVASTGTAVYAGGHQRWMNNNLGNDNPGPGAVPRPGLVALDPRTGIPLSWNPGRNPRGAGAAALLATDTGLWVGSDTEWIGDAKYRRERIAFFPLAGGLPVASDAVPNLPGGVYTGAPAGVAGATPVLYRVNAGGPALQSVDSGPDWADDSGSASPYRNPENNAAGYAPVPQVNSTVPVGTPRAIFDSERWDGGSKNDGQEMRWAFPVPAGQQVDVRVYLANRCTCTSAIGSRKFDVSIDGVLRLNDYDIRAQVGDQVGSMRTWTITSDGTVNIDFGHEVENPLVNGIEIVRTGVGAPVPTPGALVRRNYDGTTVAAAEPVTSDLNWTGVRGATLIGGTLFYGKTDGNFYRRSFDGEQFGAETAVDPYNDPTWSTVDTGSGQTFKGNKSNFYGEISNLTSLFYDGSGRLYYTLFGQTGLYYRSFSPDSGIVHPVRQQVAGVTMPDITGAFLAGGQFYYVTRANGNLNRIAWSGGVPSGASAVVSGPGTDSVDWRSKVLFLGPASVPNSAPTAALSVTCTLLNCSANGSASADSDGSIASYAWNFGDGATASGVNATHSYAGQGSYTVTLTVTDNEGATATATQNVTVAPAPVSTIAFRAAASANATWVKPTITVPASVQAGDALVLAVTSGTATAHTPPSGWSQVSSQLQGTVLTTVWQKVATASDAGSSVLVTLTNNTKVDLQLLAYSGTAAASPVSAVSAADAVSSTSHTAPAATVTAPGSLVVRYWADKSSATTGWTAPAGLVIRAGSIGTGTGYISSLVAEEPTAFPAGPVGTSVATANASTKGTGVTIVLAPAG